MTADVGAFAAPPGAAGWGELPLRHRFHVATDVLVTPTWLAVAATRTVAFRRTRCPVALLPSATWFFVDTGTPLDPHLARAHGVRLVPLDELPLPAAPQADPGAGPLSWWVTPEATESFPGDAAVVLEALRTVAGSRSPALR